ncbi:hypothetical protein [Pedobacter sp. NJ-S-72]
MIVLIDICSASAQDIDTMSISYRNPLFDFNPRKPVFKFNPEQGRNTSRLLRFSVVTGYRQGVQSIRGLMNFSNSIDTSNGTNRYYAYNLSLEDIFTHGFYKPNKVILEVKNPSHYLYDPSQGSKEEWMRKNAYCFEFLIPMGSIDSFDIINKELSRVFGVEFGLKKRIVNALVLVRTSNSDKIKSLGKGERKYTNQGYINNFTLDRLGSILYDAGFAPMVDETGYAGPVDLDLRIDSLTDLITLRKSLQHYDLDLKEEKREVEMFVITEIK